VTVLSPPRAMTRIVMSKKHRFTVHAVSGALAGTFAQAAGLDVWGALGFAIAAAIVLRLTTKRSAGE
jgi:hypothetical protein